MKTSLLVAVKRSNTTMFKTLSFLFLFFILLHYKAIAQIPTDGLVAYWNLDETSGLVAHDGTTNGNNGNLIGANWPAGDAQWITNGYVGGALHFYPDPTSLGNANVTATRVEVTSITNAGVATNIWAASPSTTNSQTWAAWIRLKNYTSFQNLIGEPIGSGAGNNLGFDTAGSTPRVLWNNGGVNSVSVQSSGGAIPTNVWTHLALTYDYQNQSNLTLYVNGTARGSAINAGTSKFLGTIELGARGNFTYGFPGDMDDVYIYNRALSPAEIAALAGVPFGPPQFTTSPQNTLVSQGDVATMSVSAAGVGTLSYQWYKDNVLVMNATNTV
ncbi:MAG TPA: LamG-like jellyroll fold domain-containing protein, partial [Verrucomicrobiae bacterium]|nr:LamG-like jellyroll fold domain-containing protein [Verrucomicrobiae bacterium]